MAPDCLLLCLSSSVGDTLPGVGQQSLGVVLGNAAERSKIINLLKIN